MRQLKGRTDLAVELKEDIKSSNGVQVKTKEDEAGIWETRIIVESEEGEKLLGKPMGNYITIEGEALAKEEERYQAALIRVLCRVLGEFLKDKKKLLVLGLGNRKITPDALGPYVTERLYITRHLIREGVLKTKKSLSAIAPGVMAQTGMEPIEIMEGIVSRAKPDIVLAIDALAARNAQRLNAAIQLSDTGIVPGSGVGNHRNAITGESLGVPVIALGVPTVISVPAILYTAMETFEKQMRELPIGKKMGQWSEAEKRQLAYEICSERLAQMFVTPKNIDEEVKKMSDIISGAINAYIVQN